MTAAAGQSPGGWRGQLLAAWTAATNAAPKNPGSDESLRLRETDAFKAVCTKQTKLQWCGKHKN